MCHMYPWYILIHQRTHTHIHTRSHSHAQIQTHTQITFRDFDLTFPIILFSFIRFRVEIAHVAAQTSLPREIVEKKLAEMILDDKLLGTLDEQRGILICIEKERPNMVAQHTTKILSTLNDIVDVLACKVNAVA